MRSDSSQLPQIQIGSPGQAPLDDWEPWTPRPTLTPGFEREGNCLTVSGAGNEQVFGCWRRTFPCRGGQWYRIRVRFETQAVPDLSLHVLNLVLWPRAGSPSPWAWPHDYVSDLKQTDQGVVGEEVVCAPADATSAEIQLGIRFCPAGTVTWREVSLTETAPPVARPARVSAALWRGRPGATLAGNREELAQLLDASGQGGCDLVLLPEYCSCSGTEALDRHDLAAVSEEVPDGPTCALMSSKARQHGMYVAGGVVERDGEVLFNTVALFGRRGELLGTYRKIHPYWPEEMWGGLSPGEGLDVFSLDFGRVGVMTCYDSWFPETARLLALKGAEVILFPSAGYHPELLPARAVDNGAYVVASSLNGPAMVVDSLGATRAVVARGPAGDSEAPGALATAVIDVSHRPSPHPNAGGSLNRSPAGRRGVRNASSSWLYGEILREVQQC